MVQLPIGWTIAAFFLGIFVGSFRRVPSAGVAPDPSRLAPDDLAAIDAALAAGRRIEAVRRLRKGSGCSLADAKAFIDRRSPPGPRRGDPIER